MPATDDRAQALDRLRAASRSGEAGALAVDFDPRAQDYDPTPDLDRLGIHYDVALMQSTDGSRAWFQARFQQLPDS